MNKIYKVIWSKVKNCYVVVSEVAKSHTRDKSQSSVFTGHSLFGKQTMAICTVLAMLGGFGVGEVHAEAPANNIELGNNSKDSVVPVVHLHSDTGGNPVVIPSQVSDTNAEKIIAKNYYNNLHLGESEARNFVYGLYPALSHGTIDKYINDFKPAPTGAEDFTRDITINAKEGYIQLGDKGTKINAVEVNGNGGRYYSEADIDYFPIISYYYNTGEYITNGKKERVYQTKKDSDGYTVEDKDHPLPIKVISYMDPQNGIYFGRTNPPIYNRVTGEVNQVHHGKVDGSDNLEDFRGTSINLEKNGMGDVQAVVTTDIVRSHEVNAWEFYNAGSQVTDNLIHLDHGTLKASTAEDDDEPELALNNTGLATSRVYIGKPIFQNPSTKETRDNIINTANDSIVLENVEKAKAEALGVVDQNHTEGQGYREISGLTNLKFNPEEANNFKDSTKAATEAQLLTSYKTLKEITEGQLRDLNKMINDIQPNAGGGSIGLNYEGDLPFGTGTDAKVNVKLGETLKLTGGVASGKSANDFVDGNIAVVNTSKDGKSTLELRLAKDIKDLNLVAIGKDNDEAGNSEFTKGGFVINSKDPNNANNTITTTLDGATGLIVDANGEDSEHHLINSTTMIDATGLNTTGTVSGQNGVFGDDGDVNNVKLGNQGITVVTKSEEPSQPAVTTITTIDSDGVNTDGMVASTKVDDSKTKATTLEGATFTSAITDSNKPNDKDQTVVEGSTITSTETVDGKTNTTTVKGATITTSKDGKETTIDGDLVTVGTEATTGKPNTQVLINGGDGTVSIGDGILADGVKNTFNVGGETGLDVAAPNTVNAQDPTTINRTLKFGGKRGLDVAIPTEEASKEAAKLNFGGESGLAVSAKENANTITFGGTHGISVKSGIEKVPGAHDTVNNEQVNEISGLTNLTVPTLATFETEEMDTLSNEDKQDKEKVKAAKEKAKKAYENKLKDLGKSNKAATEAQLGGLAEQIGDNTSKIEKNTQDIKTNINNINQTVGQGLNYEGDLSSGTGADAKVNVILGQTLKLTGEVASGKTANDFVGGNIAIVKDDNNKTYKVLMNKDVAGLTSVASDSFQTPGATPTTKLDAESLKVGGDNGLKFTLTPGNPTASPKTAMKMGGDTGIQFNSDPNTEVMGASYKDGSDLKADKLVNTIDGLSNTHWENNYASKTGFNASRVATEGQLRDLNKMINDIQIHAGGGSIGLNYEGDLPSETGTDAKVNVKPGDTLKLTGGVAGKSANDFVDGNIAVVNTSKDGKSTLELRLAKDIKDVKSITLGDKDAEKKVVISSEVKDHKTTNEISGLTNTDLPDIKGDEAVAKAKEQAAKDNTTLSNEDLKKIREEAKAKAKNELNDMKKSDKAATEAQVAKAITDAHEAATDAANNLERHFNADEAVENSTNDIVRKGDQSLGILGGKVKVTTITKEEGKAPVTTEAEHANIITKADATAGTISVNLNTELKGLAKVEIGDDSTPNKVIVSNGKDGKDGITVVGKKGENGKDGSTTTVIGKDGISITGPKGADGKTSEVTLNDKGIFGGNTYTEFKGDITPDANGKAGTNEATKVDLGKGLDITGGFKADKDKTLKEQLTDGNIAVVNTSTTDKNGNVASHMEVHLANDIKGLKSISAENTDSVAAKDDGTGINLITKDSTRLVNGRDVYKAISDLSVSKKYAGDRVAEELAKEKSERALTERSIQLEKEDTVLIAGGAAGKLTDSNIGTVVHAEDKGKNEKAFVSVHLAEDLKNINSIDFGNQDENKPTVTHITKNGVLAPVVGVIGGPIMVGATTDDKGNKLPAHLNMNNSRVVNMADGIAPQDGVTVRQLGQGLQMIDKKVEEANRNASNAGALSAAMAGLKPISYDPYEPTQFMGAVGYYHGSSAIALGLSHYTNEDKVIHGGVSFNGGKHVMGNLGITIKFGSHEKDSDNPIYNKYRNPIKRVEGLMKEMDKLRAENTALKEKVDSYDAVIKENKELHDKVEEQDQRLDAQQKQIDQIMALLQKK